MRYRTYEYAGSQHVAVQSDGAWWTLGDRNLTDLIRFGEQANAPDLSASVKVDVASAKLLPPIPRPGKIICVGLNYLDHAKERHYDDVPDYPSFFARFATSLVGANNSIIRPSCSKQLDYEGELLAVIGSAARNVSESEALNHVAGYSIFNDGSLRDYQYRSKQWTPGKNFDATGAFGPDFVTADELPDGAAGLDLEVLLNGTTVQSANTSDMIFPVARLVATASEFMTLEPGDIIATGTPAGVGAARTPPLFMKHGDVVEVRIEGIGALVNPVRDQPVARPDERTIKEDVA